MANKPPNLENYLGDLSEAELHFVEKICQELDNKMVYSRWVELKSKEKKSRRILVISSYMVLVIKKLKDLSKRNKAQFPGNVKLKVLKRYHLLDMKSITTFKNPLQLELQFKNRVNPLRLFSPLVAEIIRAIRNVVRLFSNGFPNASLPALFGVRDQDLLPLDNIEDYGPANGFLQTYAAYCCYYKQPISKEVMRYVTDLQEAGVIEFSLTDCPGIEPKGGLNISIAAIAAAFRYNTYFRSLSAVHVGRKELLYLCSNIFRYNTFITKLTLSHLSDGIISELGEALQYNPNNALQVIDISGTKIRGFTSFCCALTSFQHALQVLNLSDTGLEGKQLYNLSLVLVSNYGMSLTLEELDLSRNRFDEQATLGFETWLSQAAEYSKLQVIRLADTNQSFDTLAAYFHFLSELRVLDISKNKLETRAVQLICSMAEKSSTLQELYVSHCNLTGRNAAALIASVVQNKRLKATIVDVSSNDLTEPDAEFLASSIIMNYNCKILNLSRNKFKEKGLIGLLQSTVLSACTTLDSLILDYIFKNSYEGQRVASAIMSVTNSLSSVKKVSIAGGFGSVAIPFMTYLQKNNTLLELDVSCNNMGDAGAAAISELLRVNTTLISITCDGNNISPTGWKMILASFMHNSTLLLMDMPWNDYTKWSSLPGDKLVELRAVLLDIQRALLSNHDASKLDRFKPVIGRPLLTVIHSLAVVPKKLLNSNLALSSLAAEKINFKEEDAKKEISPRDYHKYDDRYTYNDDLPSSASESEFDDSNFDISEDEYFGSKRNSNSSLMHLPPYPAPSPTPSTDSFVLMNHSPSPSSTYNHQRYNNSIIFNGHEDVEDNSNLDNLLDNLSDDANNDNQETTDTIYSSDESFDI